LKKIIVLGGGCFWCTEEVFKRVNGVINVTPGYAGGHTIAPSYKEVCSGWTGHAEVIEVSYDEKKVKLSYLLDVFFMAHDPTSYNRQGLDVGSQYRSIIFFSDEKEKREAEDAVGRAQNSFKQKIVTEISKLEGFHPAESYHKDYYAKNPLQPYCMLVIKPKIKLFEEKLKDS
jgi:peptide-methionine (S)-S-oxide reductase